MSCISRFKKGRWGGLGDWVGRIVGNFIVRGHLVLVFSGLLGDMDFGLFCSCCLRESRVMLGLSLYVIFIFILAEMIFEHSYYSA